MNEIPHASELEFDLYLDGELDAVRRAGLEMHLQTCPACAQALRRRAALFQALSHPPEAPAPDLRAGVLAALRRRDAPSGLNTARAESTRGRYPTFLRWTAGVQALSAVLLLAFSLPTLLPRGLALIKTWLNSLPPFTLSAPSLPALNASWDPALELLHSPLPALPMALEILAAALLAWLLVNGLLLIPRRNR
jgi:anti-sigma factor RsiW